MAGKLTAWEQKLAAAKVAELAEAGDDDGGDSAGPGGDFEGPARPALNASRALWAVYAESQGVDPSGMSRDAIKAALALQ